MNRYIIIIHGFGPHKDDRYLIKHLENARYKVIYYDWFNWSKVFSIELFKSRLIDDLKNKNIVGIIGVSIGGLIAGRYVKYFSNIPIILISSAPKFKPSIYVRPLFFNKYIFKIVYKIYISLKINNHCKNIICRLIKFGQNFEYSYLDQLRRYLISENNVKQLNLFGKNTICLNGQKDNLMPVINWKGVNIKEVIEIKNSDHTNTLNNNTMKIILNILKGN